MDVHLYDRNRVTFWIESSLFNELLSQFNWNFEWIHLNIPFTSDIIPEETRNFLYAFCVHCYFEIGTAPKGKPSVSVEENSIVFKMANTVHLQIVNPRNNVTSVVLFFVFTARIEIEPVFERGTLRTRLHVIQTTFEMEKGAIPKEWGVAVHDLQRDLIQILLWPQIKNAVEGVRLTISESCGVDPYFLDLEIRWFTFTLECIMRIDNTTIAVSARLSLENFEPDSCVKDFKNSLPDLSTIFSHFVK